MKKKNTESSTFFYNNVENILKSKKLLTTPQKTCYTYPDNAKVRMNT